MSASICGISCTACELSKTCKGCAETNGKPFGGDCVVASCYRQKGEEVFCKFKAKLIDAFNALGIEDMEKVTDLNALRGSFVNLEYTLPGGQAVKFWDNDKIILGNQLHKKDSDRCYGIAADEKYLLVCEYGCEGSDAEIVVYKRWN